MKQLKFTTRLAVALLASTALLGTAVYAETGAAKAPAAAAAQKTDQPGIMLKVSDHAATALDGVTAARMALMQWSGDQAKTILTQVKATLEKAKDGLDTATLVKFGGNDAASQKLLTDTMYYPVGISTDTMTDISTPPAQKTAAVIDQSNPLPDETTDQVKAEQQVAGNGGSAHQAGQPGASVDTETVDTSVIVALLPRDATVHAIDAAIAQIDKGDLAAADLALDSINGSILYGSMTQSASAPVTG